MERQFRMPPLPEARGEEGGEEMMPFSPFHPAEEPAVDIYQDKNNLYVEIALGGVKPENVSVSIEDNILYIEGKVEEKKESKGRDYFTKEIRRGSFRRALKLPVDVKSNQAKAESFGGMLKISVPKVAKAAPQAKKVPIKIK